MQNSKLQVRSSPGDTHCIDRLNTPNIEIEKGVKDSIRHLFLYSIEDKMQASNGRPSWGLEDVIIYVSLVSVQFATAVIVVLMKDQLSNGANALVFLAYTNAIGALVLSPFAFFLEKGERSALGFPLALLLVLLSLSGVCFQALMLMGLKETSPAFATAMPNLAPAMIVVMAWGFGMEKVDLKCAHSRFKLSGTVICVCGAMVMSFLHGPALSQLSPSPQHSKSQNILHSYLHEGGNSENSITGCIYLISAVIILSSSMILQAETLKTYPAPLSVAAMTGALASFQTTVLATIQDKGVHTTTWLLDWSGVATVIYGGTVYTAILATQLWCMKKRGPVFVAIFSPINTVCSAIMSLLFLGETLHLGSVMGALLIFGGLYMVLLGKGKETPTDKEILLDEKEHLQSKRIEVDLLREDFQDVKIPLLY